MMSLLQQHPDEGSGAQDPAHLDRSNPRNLKVGIGLEKILFVLEQEDAKSLWDELAGRHFSAITQMPTIPSECP
jgi:hypothetical protein